MQQRRNTLSELGKERKIDTQKLGKEVEPGLEGESENVPEKWRVEQPRVWGITSR